jgi:hypothetical protein
MRDSAVHVAWDAGSPHGAFTGPRAATTVSWGTVALIAMTLATSIPSATAQAAPADTTRASAVADSTRVPQRDILDVLGGVIGRKAKPLELSLEPRPGLSFALLPSVGYNPSYGAFIGVSASVGGWLGDPTTTTLSSGAAGASVSTTGQISVQVKTDFFTPDNALALKGDWRYLDTTQPTYGLGPASDEQTKVDMGFLLYRIYQAVYWHVPNTAYFAGPGFHLDIWDQIEEKDVPPDTVTDYELYSRGAVSQAKASGVSFNVLYDTRDNPINARKGTYWNVSLRSYLKGLGSDDDWQAVWSDLRIYPSMPKGSRNTFAIWNYAWFSFGQAPYLDLPAIGWDTYGRGGRGYLQGRIRGQNQIYLEGEYRAALTRDGLLGSVVFVNLLATNIPASGQFGRPDLGAGAGLRFKYNKRTSTNLAVDLAYDEFGTAHVFFGLQEVF